MKSQTPYSEAPDLLKAFAPEYRTEEYHLATGAKATNLEMVKSIFKDPHYEVNRAIGCIVKGALIAAGLTIAARRLVKRGPKQFENLRLYLWNKGPHPFFYPLRGWMAYGGFMGLSWYLIKYQLCCSHGQDTLTRNTVANGLFGSLLFMTLWHPANITWGFIAGVLVGGGWEAESRPEYPKGFELKMNFVDQDLRKKLLREDEEYQMSTRTILHTGYNFTPV